jgi:hypothetical protein
MAALRTPYTYYVTTPYAALPRRQAHRQQLHEDCQAFTFELFSYTCFQKSTLWPHVDIAK